MPLPKKNMYFLHGILGTRIDFHVVLIFCPARSIPGNFKRFFISEDKIILRTI